MAAVHALRPGALVKIASIGCDLHLAEVYERVEVGTERTAPTLRIVDQGNRI